MTPTDPNRDELASNGALDELVKTLRERAERIRQWRPEDRESITPDELLDLLADDLAWASKYIKAGGDGR